MPRAMNPAAVKAVHTDGIRWIAFDAGGTLLGVISPLPVVALYEALGIEWDPHPCAVFNRARDGYHLFESARHRSGHPLDPQASHWRQILSDACGGREPLASSLFKWFIEGRLDSLYPDVYSTLEDLRRGGYRMCVVSNFAPTLEDRLRELGIHHFFDFFVVSSTHGVSKPNPRLFALAVEQAEAAASEMLYVGDNPDSDVSGALAAGMHVVLVDRNNLYAGISVPLIPSLAALPGLLR